MGLEMSNTMINSNWLHHPWRHLNQIPSDGLADDEQRDGLRYRIQRLLLGRQAAEVYFQLRRELLEQDRVASESKISGRDAWVVTTEAWPTDGSWTPSEGAIAVLFGAAFEEAHGNLSESLRMCPVTESAAYKAYAARYDNEHPQSAAVQSSLPCGPEAS